MKKAGLAISLASSIVLTLAACETVAEKPLVPHSWAPVPSMFIDSFRVVFFDLNSAAISPDSRAILQDIVIMARNLAPLSIELRGHTDSAGSAEDNLRLSRRRAQAVKAELINLGLTNVELVVVANGETTPLIPTGDDVREPQNRRVEVELVGDWYQQMLADWCQSLPPSELIQAGIRHPACD